MTVSLSHGDAARGKNEAFTRTRQHGLYEVATLYEPGATGKTSDQVTK